MFQTTNQIGIEGLYYYILPHYTLNGNYEPTNITRRVPPCITFHRREVSHQFCSIFNCIPNIFNHITVNPVQSSIRSILNHIPNTFNHIQHHQSTFSDSLSQFDIAIEDGHRNSEFSQQKWRIFP